MSNDDNDGISEDEFRTVLAYSALSYAKQVKVVNDGLVSVLNNECAITAKSEDEHELAKDAYMATKEAYEALNDLSQSLDETDDDEQSVAAQFNPAADDGGEEQ